MMALIKQNNVFYLFAIVIKFTSILDMEQRLSSLPINLHIDLFELIAVQLSKKLL